MSKVEISINGRLYAVACDDGQEDRVRDLGGMIDQRMRQLAGPGPMGAVGESHFLVLAGLMLADELTEAEATLAARDMRPAEAVPAQGDCRGDGGDTLDEDLLIAAVDHLTERIALIADRLASH